MSDKPLDAKGVIVGGAPAVGKHDFKLTPAEQDALGRNVLIGGFTAESLDDPEHIERTKQIFEKAAERIASETNAEAASHEREKKRSEKKVPVVEMFGPTIEGEGSLIGMQTMFIRFGLCDYKCTMCDSKHAVDPNMVKVLAAWKTQKEIADDMLALMPEHIENVTFSGGNPAIHDLAELVFHLKTAGKKIYVETQGTKHPAWLGTVDHVVVSPKSPGMGESFDAEVFREFLSSVLGSGVRVSVKVVVFNVVDLEFAAAIAKICKEFKYPWFRVTKDFFLSLGNDSPPDFVIGVPEGAGVEGEGLVVTDNNLNIKKDLVGNLLNRYNKLSDEIMRDPRLSFARFLPQLHVLVWGNETGK